MSQLILKQDDKNSSVKTLPFLPHSLALRVVHHLSLSPSCVTRKKSENVRGKSWRAQLFVLAVYFRVVDDRLRGRVPFDENFRKLPFKIKWNRNFPEIRFENFGLPFEVVLGRVPFDQKFQFDFPKFSYVEWNGIFHFAGPISFHSRLITLYSTKC